LDLRGRFSVKEIALFFWAGYDGANSYGDRLERGIFMNWYIVKQPDKTCQIVDDLAVAEAAAEKWGPYSLREEAIAKRIGLIRAGKCTPL
jgi:hypothetical protein